MPKVKAASVGVLAPRRSQLEWECYLGNAARSQVGLHQGWVNVLQRVASVGALQLRTLPAHMPAEGVNRARSACVPQHTAVHAAHDLIQQRQREQ